jgi:hypothetical protein
MVSGIKIPHSFAVFFLKGPPDSFLESFREGHSRAFWKNAPQAPLLNV